MQPKTKKVLKFLLKWFWIVFSFGSLIFCAFFYEFNITMFKNISLSILTQNLIAVLVVHLFANEIVKVHPIFGKGILSRWNVKTNLALVPLKEKFIAIPFFILLIFDMPTLATLEEIIFRNGTTSWFEGAWRSVLFGMVHLLTNMPLGGTIALSFLGMWFTLHYFRGGLPMCSMHHFSYNILAFLVFSVFVFIKYIKEKRTKQQPD